MIPIYVCDDQPEICAFIVKEIDRHVTISDYDMGPIFSACSILDFFEIFQPEKIPAIYFLDVDLKEDSNGFHLATKIRELDPLGYLIFITNHGNLATETFRYQLQVLDYIEKSEEDCIIQRIQRSLDTINQNVLLAQSGKMKYFSFKVFDTIRHIPLDDIVFMEANGKSHRISLSTDNEVIDFFGSLNAISEELGNMFFRCHRGFIVNRNKIKKIDLLNNLIYLEGDNAVPLSRSAKKDLKSEYK